MSARRRKATRWLLCGSLVLLLWWLFHVPRPPGGLLSAVPANASAVGLHEHLAARWSTLSGSPMVATLASSMGVEPSAIKQLMARPEWAFAVRLLIPHEGLWACVPGQGRLDESCWMFASWLGARSHILRWVFEFSAPEGSERRALPHGGSYWTLEGSGPLQGMRVCFTFAEGVMMGVVGGGDAMRRVMEAFDGAAPSFDQIALADGGTNACAEAAAWDRGWLRWSGRDPSRMPDVLSYSLARLDNERISGQLCLPAGVVAPATVGAGLDTDPMRRWMGPEPVAVCALDPLSLASLLSAAANPVWARVLTEVLVERGIGAVTGMVMDGEKGGRYMGVKVPTLLVAVQAKEPDAMIEAAARALDRLNAELRWGLIPRAVPVGEETLYAVEATNEKGERSLVLTERPAYAVINGRFLLASNLEALARLAGAAHRETAPVAGPAAWEAALAERPAAAAAWFDFPRTSAAMKALIKFYSLKLLATDAGATQDQRQRLNVLSAWLSAIEPMKECRLALSGDDSTTRLHFTLGTPP